MSREQILTKAIAIAKRNGFDISDDFFTETSTELWLQPGQDLYFSLIFDHDFAKSFFPDDVIEIDGFEELSEEVSIASSENPIAALMTNRKNIKIPAWEFHLGQMVFSKDPLTYIEKFIEDDGQEIN